MKLKRIREYSVAYTILNLISYATEISPKIFHHFNDHSYNTYMNEVVELTKPNTYIGVHGDNFEDISVLKINGKGKYKTIRLTQRAYDEMFLELIGVDAHTRYDINSYHKYQDHQVASFIERNHNVSELYCMLSDNGVEHYWINQNYMDRTNAVEDVFMSIRMIKELYPSKATHQGRSYGVLLFKKKCHTVYMFDKATTHWNSEAELRNKTIINNAIKDNITLPKTEDQSMHENAVIISKNIQLAYDLLNGRGLIDGNKQGLRIDQTYKNFRFIPQKYVDQMLHVIEGGEDFIEQIKKASFVNSKKSKLIDCDVVDKDNVHWLFTFDLNLNRMRRFKKFTERYADRSYIVFGFDWQKELLNKYYDTENVQVATNEYEQVMKIINQP